MKSIKEKLGIKDNKQVLVVHAPDSYKEVKGHASVKEADIIQLFASSKKEIQDFLDKNVLQLKPTVALWITYPKASPHLGINRDIIAEFLISYGFKGVAICSIDQTWSGLRFKKVPAISGSINEI